MSAPPGFNPDTSLLQQNASAPIVPFRGGGTPLSLDAFYQAILKGQPETIRKMLPESIADITSFAISVEDGKFVLKMKVKGKKKGAADEIEKAAAIAAVEALKAANEANETEEAIAAVAASEAAAKAEAEEAKKKEEEEILKKAREFLILEAARAFLRSQRQSEFNPNNDSDIAEPLLDENENENEFGPFQSAPNPENNNVGPNIAATLHNLKNTPLPPITTPTQAVLNAANKKVKQGVTTGIIPERTNISLRQSSRPIYGTRQGSPSPPNANAIRAEAAAVDKLQRMLEEAQSVVNESKRLATTRRGLVESTRARRGTLVQYPSIRPPGTGVTATPANVQLAIRAAAQLTGTTPTVTVTGAKTATPLKKIGFGSNDFGGTQAPKLSSTERIEQSKKQRIELAKKDFTSIRNDTRANKKKLLERYKRIHPDLLKEPEIKGLITQIETSTSNPP